MNRWQRVDGAIERVEQTLLVTLLGFIILLAFLQIFLRNFLSTRICHLTCVCSRSSGSESLDEKWQLSYVAFRVLIS